MNWCAKLNLKPHSYPMSSANTPFTLRCQIASLLLFRDIFQRDMGAAFLVALKQRCRDAHPLKGDMGQDAGGLEAYGKWFQGLIQHQKSWHGYLTHYLLYEENPLSQWVKDQGTTIPEPLAIALRHDLHILSAIAHQGPSILATGLELPFLDPNQLPNRAFVPPDWLPLGDNWAGATANLVEWYATQGTGLTTQFLALRWQRGKLQGIPNPDWVAMEALVGYEDQRDVLCRNTEALLRGHPALNVLLYGSRGSGKSALVKALLPKYGDRGLRLIELGKAELIHLNEIVAWVGDAPQKFVIFVDDLSFEEGEDQYKALKVVLEGTLTARPRNIVVYATSNRRHLIREFFDDRPRPSDAHEIHTWDTVQEKLSLSDRFGLALTFGPANQEQYLRMVNHLAQRAGLDIPSNTLEFEALQWATRHNGRSGRTAQQFIDYLQAVSKAE
jgi:uncharacterized protein